MCIKNIKMINFKTYGFLEDKEKMLKVLYVSLN